jgi:hypothetical protein
VNKKLNKEKITAKAREKIMGHELVHEIIRDRENVFMG